MGKNRLKVERWISLVGGAVVLGGATALLLYRRSRGEGGSRAFRGKWPLPEGARLVQPGEQEELEREEAAAGDSFPASDPPAYTPPG